MACVTCDGNFKPESRHGSPLPWQRHAALPACSHRDRRGAVDKRLVAAADRECCLAGASPNAAHDRLLWANCIAPSRQKQQQTTLRSGRDFSRPVRDSKDSPASHNHPAFPYPLVLRTSLRSQVTSAMLGSSLYQLNFLSASAIYQFQVSLLSASTIALSASTSRSFNCRFRSNCRRNGFCLARAFTPLRRACSAPARSVGALPLLPVRRPCRPPTALRPLRRPPAALSARATSHLADCPPSRLRAPGRFRVISEPLEGAGSLYGPPPRAGRRFRSRRRGRDASPLRPARPGAHWKHQQHEPRPHSSPLPAPPPAQALDVRVRETPGGGQRASRAEVPGHVDGDEANQGS